MPSALAAVDAVDKVVRMVKLSERMGVDSSFARQLQRKFGRRDLNSIFTQDLQYSIDRCLVINLEPIRCLYHAAASPPRSGTLALLSAL